jgi:hypothetical protein
MSLLKAEEDGLLDERERLLAALDCARHLINRRYAPRRLAYLDCQIAAVDRRLRQIAWEQQNSHCAWERHDVHRDDDPWGPLGWR